MAGVASTHIIGNVGRDPEMRYLQNGTPVATTSVAVTRKWTDKNTGEEKSKTVWYRVTFWRQLAETVNQYVRKGMQVYVEGEMETPTPYLDKSGQPAASLDLTAQTIQFLGQRGDNGAASDTGEPVTVSVANADDIPF